MAGGSGDYKTRVTLTVCLGGVAVLSLGLLLWQWLGARRFPLHEGIAPPAAAPGVTLFKPVEGCEAGLAEAWTTWGRQNYPGPVQLLLGVRAHDTTAVAAARQWVAQHPECDASVVLCPAALGTNGKISKLLQMQPHARHDVLVVSDADTAAPPEFLGTAVALLRDPGVGLVTAFYALEGATDLPSHWEAVGVNADFWSQVLQARDLGPIRFGLGAAMATRRSWLAAAGGWEPLSDLLADDYHLGRAITQAGGRVELCPVVVQCRERARGWVAAWRHQLRWARAIRVSRPAAYAFSLLANATVWPLVWVGMEGVRSLAGGHVQPGLPAAVLVAGAALGIRMTAAIDLQQLLTRRGPPIRRFWLPWLKDLLGAAVWVAAWTGDRIDWAGAHYRVGRDGKLGRR